MASAPALSFSAPPLGGVVHSRVFEPLLLAAALDER